MLKKSAGQAIRIVLVIVTGLAPLAGPAFASDPPRGTGAAGSWNEVSGPARFFHTAVLLKDGKVLVAGGCPTVEENVCMAATKESLLFDPKTNKWTPTGEMSIARAGHAATLLPDGRVLVVSGCSKAAQSPEGPKSSLGWCGEHASSAEIYDPAKGRWTAANPVPSGLLPINFRSHPIVSLVPESKSIARCGDNCGKVLIIGEFSEEGSLAETVDGESPQAVRCPEGGEGCPRGALLFDPTTGDWALTAKMPDSGPWLSSATSLQDGRALFHGAHVSIVYDPAAESWSPSGGEPINRGYHTATLLANEETLVAGGIGPAFSPAGEALSSSELVVPVKKGAEPQPDPTKPGSPPAVVTWKPASSMAKARFSHTATLLKDGSVLVTGGSEKFGEGRADAEIFTATRRRWAPAPSMAQKRGGQVSRYLPPGTEYELLMAATSTSLTSTLLNDGRVLVVGGSAVPSSELFQPAGLELEKKVVDRRSLRSIWYTAGGLVLLLVLVVTVKSRLRKNQADQA